ncbi:TRAP transporter small permease [Marivita hallyeonensis]|uniref:TRAP transporter small permease protein n=1 Tax=Marivita hallyeonensis TaxID=996342 RepID=A0A1M5WG54_9RHOB|nr:TRAP transporter small permease [Marivita hallyeonensis]SHH86378.1 TRAP-type C4-dicarboxylate transport system, small permease component [Marivita hallyeonensis]
MAVQSNAHAARTGDNWFLKTVAFLSLLSGWTAAALIVASVFITCQMIFVRFVLNQSTIWQTEAVVYMMIAATMLGLPYVQRLRGHVNVDLIPLALPLKARKLLFYVTMSLSILVMGIMGFYAFEYWHIAWERNWRSDTVWGVRLWIPYLALPIGFALFILQLIADTVAVAIGVDKPFGIGEVS